MKYSININQRAVVDLGLDLDLTDMAILDFMSEFAHTEECEKAWVDAKGACAYWFSTKLILEQLPILRITERAVRQHINNLIDMGLLERYGDPRRTQKSYFLFGPTYAKLFFATTPSTVPSDDVSSRTSEKNCRDLGNKLPTPRKSISDNNNINILDNKGKDVVVNKQKPVFAETTTAESPVQGRLELFDAAQPDVTVEAATAKERKSSAKKKEIVPVPPSPSSEFERKTVDECAEELLSKGMVMESIMMSRHCDRGYIESRLKEIVLHRKSLDKAESTYRDFVSHFNNWLSKREQAEVKEFKESTAPGKMSAVDIQKRNAQYIWDAVNKAFKNK